MYYTKGINEIISTFNKAFGLSPMKFDLSDISLKKAYYIFLKNKSVFEDYSFLDEVNFTDFQGLKKISPEFCQKKEIHFAVNSPLLMTRLSNGFFAKALSHLKKQNKELHQLVNFLIKIILINQLNSYTDGTTEMLVCLYGF